jgi:hypothetical protein
MQELIYSKILKDDVVLSLYFVKVMGGDGCK